MLSHNTDASGRDGQLEGLFDLAVLAAENETWVSVAPFRLV
jgi:hypothetical protein